MANPVLVAAGMALEMERRRNDQLLNEIARLKKQVMDRHPTAESVRMANRVRSLEEGLYHISMAAPGEDPVEQLAMLAKYARAKLEER